jgi:hypothetical protein
VDDKLLKTASEVAQDQAIRDERDLHRRVQWFTEKWTIALDLNKRDAAEFTADFTTVVQAVHRDATRDISAILTKIMMAIPPAPLFVKRPD